MSIVVNRDNWKSYLGYVNNVLNRISSLDLGYFNIKNLNEIKNNYLGIKVWEDPVGEMLKKRLNDLNNNEYYAIYNSITKGNYKELTSGLNEAKSCAAIYETRIREYDAAKAAYESACEALNNYDSEEDDEYTKGDLIREKNSAETAMNEAHRKEEQARIDLSNALNKLSTIRFEESKTKPKEFVPEKYAELTSVQEVYSDTFVEYSFGIKQTTEVFFDSNTGNRALKDKFGNISIFTSNKDGTVSIYSIPHDSKYNNNNMNSLLMNPPKEALTTTCQGQGKYKVSIKGKTTTVIDHAQDKFFFYATQNGFIVD